MFHCVQVSEGFRITSYNVCYTKLLRWMMAQTKDIIGHADQYAKDHCGDGIIALPTWRIRKETVAHERQQQKQMSSGLIGVWSCLEAGSSYRARYCVITSYSIHYTKLYEPSLDSA